VTGREGGWLQTYTGRQFWPLDPRASEVDIVDIAHALSNMCRFGGHCEEFYSVAQHSYLVSSICPPEDALWGLLHDASEAYLVDIPRPVKAFLRDYKTYERDLERVIAKRFDLPSEMPESVKRADNSLLATEARDLMKSPPFLWERLAEPLDSRIVPWSPAIAEEIFLRKFHLLQGRQ